ncbi:MAG TPA: hypothetical protein VI259_03995 [Gemmatimonadaceae bacterium]
MDRRRDRDERPLAVRRIGERYTRDLAGAVVTRDHGVAGMRPPVGPVRVRRRTAVADFRPPGRTGRGDRVELHSIARPALSATGDGEGHGRIAVHVRQAEASVVELRARDRHRGSAARFVQPSLDTDEGVANETERAPAVALNPRGRGVTEKVGNALARSRSQIDYAATRRVPWAVPREVDVDVVFI